MGVRCDVTPSRDAGNGKRRVHANRVIYASCRSMVVEKVVEKVVRGTRRLGLTIPSTMCPPPPPPVACATHTPTQAVPTCLPLTAAVHATPSRLAASRGRHGFPRGRA